MPSMVRLPQGSPSWVKTLHDGGISAVTDGPSQKTAGGFDSSSGVNRASVAPRNDAPSRRSQVTTVISTDAIDCANGPSRCQAPQQQRGIGQVVTGAPVAARVSSRARLASTPPPEKRSR